MPMQTDWAAKSWVSSANDATCGFPLQALPYCSFLYLKEPINSAHLGVGIGSFVLDLHQLSSNGLLASLGVEVEEACRADRLNRLMHCGTASWGRLRQHLFGLLREDAPQQQQQQISACLFPMEAVRFCMPVDVGNYTDFYASIHHATNVGRLFRPDQPLLPNYAWVPIGYHGRASSLVISGTAVHRPNGQYKSTGSGAPVFQPTRQLDYELEVAAYIGTGNTLGEPVSIATAEQHIFGISLLNDWSARDIQAWEAQPLGPFLGKSFATSVSPWVLATEALEPFRTRLAVRPGAMPAPLPYLAEHAHPTPSGIDLTVEVLLQTPQMIKSLLPPHRLSSANLRDLYWSFAQMIAHHTSNGCNLQPGDILASGTVSGPHPGEQGCLLELTQRGAIPVTLENGEVRSFLEDGDEIIVRGFCERRGFPRITLGECRGVILPARHTS